LTSEAENGHFAICEFKMQSSRGDGGLILQRDETFRQGRPSAGEGRRAERSVVVLSGST